ncbi:MAG: hypothetical protein HOK28_02910 [Deltaproteobacteria bacterium]|nr:hypothetical protein [Deltaproteobacteria bacterium]
MSALPICDRQVGGTSGFYGRTGELRRVLNCIQRGQSVALMGGPQVGKTSFLQELRQNQYDLFTPLYQGIKTVPVIVDLSLLGGRAALLPSLIWDALSAALLDTHARGGAGAVELKKPDFRRAGQHGWQELETSLAKTWAGLRGTEAWCHFALMFDGSEVFAKAECMEALEPLFKLLKQSEDWSPVSLVFAGDREFREFILDSKMPELKKLQQQCLGALKEDEAAMMVREMLPEANARLIKEISYLTGNHPYLLNVLLDEIIEYNLVRNLRAAADNASMRLEPLFENIWQAFDRGRGVHYRGSYAAPEHALMQVLMEMGEYGCTAKQAEREVGLRPLKEFADFLVACSVVERAMRDGQYVLQAKSMLWNDWYRQRISR